MPIVSKYPNEIVTLDLVGPYPASRPERYKFILVISDHFTKWCELIPLRKASAQTIANAFFNTYIARYGAKISLISDNGPQFISDVFEHLSHRLDIKHMKTVTYRPQSNLTERVNRNLVQMIASFVEENHENWDQFLHEFAFALRTAVNETTNKTPAELFLGRKIITPFSKLINVTEDAKYVGNNIERLFDEARRNMQKKHKSWEKHYNLRRRDVHIKVNDLVLLQTHFLSAAGRKQVRVYRPRQSDTISSDSPVETLYDEQEVSHGSNRSHQGQFKEHKKTSSQERLLRLQVNHEWKLVDVITRPVRPERQREDATNKRRNQSGRIKPIQGDLAHTIYGAVYKKKTEFHEDLNNIEINGIPGSTFRRRSLTSYGKNIDKIEIHVDKTSSNTPKSTTTYLAKKESKTGIKCIPFDDIPAASTMNFCAFGSLKQALRKRHTKTLSRLWKKVQEEWSSIVMTELGKVYFHGTFGLEL
ncbi:retrovirus-related Pol polyprotein from transposon 412 [Trichonephila clavipes]|uniref:Retrovirus-related Pol polyprotein from transposon 412 n=1 Tax=Trichonephila clavipes TaxID=2585209 RepID=A0A8X6SUG8_TRICX|nr:retrovirus-related Pol polyprotein from transposon 412 [Trichonephila clavipes]